MRIGIFCRKEKEPDYLKRQEDKQEEIRSKFLQCPPQIELPGVGIKEVYVLITHVSDIDY